MTTKVLRRGPPTNIRLTGPERAIVQEAARIGQVSVSAFLREAGLAAARRVLRRDEVERARILEAG